MAFALVITLAGCGGGGGGSAIDDNDYGKFLEENFKAVSEIYPNIGSKVATGEDSAAKADNFMYYISDKAFENNEPANERAAVLSKTKANLKSRLITLFDKFYSSDVNFSVKPLKTGEYKTDSFVEERSAIVFAAKTGKKISVEVKGKKEQIDSATFFLSALKWEKQSDGKWLIVGGIDNLFGDAETLYRSGVITTSPKLEDLMF